MPHLRNELDKYFRFYDYKRGHSAHGYKTPWEVYSENSTFWKNGSDGMTTHAVIKNTFLEDFSVQKCLTIISSLIQFPFTDFILALF